MLAGAETVKSGASRTTLERDAIAKYDAVLADANREDTRRSILVPRPWGERPGAVLLRLVAWRAVQRDALTGTLPTPHRAASVARFCVRSSPSRRRSLRNAPPEHHAAPPDRHARALAASARERCRVSRGTSWGRQCNQMSRAPRDSSVWVAPPARPPEFLFFVGPPRLSS